jgi:hypothetical protein
LNFALFLLNEVLQSFPTLAVFPFWDELLTLDVILWGCFWSYVKGLTSRETDLDYFSKSFGF